LSCRGISTKAGRGLGVVVTALVLGLALPAYASAADGGISGEVTKAAGGAAVVDAEVCAEEQGPEFVFECALTGPSGTYEIAGLPPGRYIVSFEAGESGLNLIRQFWDGVGRYEEATEVLVSSGATTPGIDAALAVGGAIAGRVTAAASGAPMSDVFVCSWEEGGEFDGCAETASDGTYEILGVPTGLHEVEFQPEVLGYEPQDLKAISVTAGAKTSNVNAALLSQGRISGHVYTAASHSPLAGVAVCGIWVETGLPGGCIHTSKTGAYEFFPVSLGAWKVVFSPEPTEFDFSKKEEINVDSLPTQFWNQKPTLAQADAIDVTSASVISGIDGLLGPGPPPATTSTPTPVAAAPLSKPKPKPKKALTCKKGFVKKRVKGHARCVRRPRRHHRRHRHH
jgi:hypothetical protein